MELLLERITKLQRFVKPNIEGNITLEDFSGFHEDLWIEKNFKIKFKANRNIERAEIYFFNPNGNSGDFGLLIDGVGSKNVEFITSSQKRGCILDVVDIKEDNEYIMTICTNLSSKVDGDIRDLVLILEKIVFY